ncbi:Aquaporin-9 [Hypsibius exemplaris]|uniref:Aquaporin-9 n=1 Tax=Hypsibius exemplaris TaxID=2072580 RepID=A0A1W0WE03_HYPEX|nr:Aquaporin-9 [Hypsibius exemplaris]
MYRLDMTVVLNVLSQMSRWTRVESTLAREALAEFLGSFILIMIGNGSIAEVVLSSGKANNFFSTNIGYGLAVMFGIYVAGGVSGGHINPAVSLAWCCLGRLQWRRLPTYVLAQYLGCLCGSAILFAIYHDALDAFDGGFRVTDPIYGNATAQIWASYPQPHVTWQNGLVDQIFATSFLMIGILAVCDEKNLRPPKGAIPAIIGLLVMVIGMSYGFNCGYPINPARDLSPRIFTAMAGWGSAPFSHRDYNWFWVPVVGPHIGALLGALIYQFFIGNNWGHSVTFREQVLIVETMVPPEMDAGDFVKTATITKETCNM